MEITNIPRAKGVSLRSAALWGVLGCLSAAPAWAQQASGGDPLAGVSEMLSEYGLQLRAGLTASHDTNFFRDPGILRSVESENIATAYAGVRFDKQYGMQRFLVDATATAYRYDKFGYLDFNGLNYLAAWYWQVTPRISGTLTAGRSEAPTQFQDTFSRQSNVAINENYAFTLLGQLNGGWHALLGASHAERSSEQSSLQTTPDFTENRAEAGVRYLFRSGNTVDALYRRIRGDQDSRTIGGVALSSGDDYREEQGEARFAWVITPAKSTLTGRLTYLDRRYDNTPQFDFDGFAGDLRYIWNPVAKLALNIAAAREISPFQGGLTSNYRVRNTLSVAPTWNATAKTTVYMTLQRSQDEYPTNVAGFEREDTTDRAVIGIGWQAARSLSLGANVLREQRSSNDPLVRYDTTVGTVNASLTF